MNLLYPVCRMWELNTKKGKKTKPRGVEKHARGEGTGAGPFTLGHTMTETMWPWDHVDTHCWGNSKKRLVTGKGKGKNRKRGSAGGKRDGRILCKGTLFKKNKGKLRVGLSLRGEKQTHTKKR